MTGPKYERTVQRLCQYGGHAVVQHRHRRTGEVSNSVHLGVYVCGITPYAAAHIGHAMVYLTYDLLIRRLRDRGRQVTLVRNVTDVDDSILEYAREHDLDYTDLAVAEVARFASEMAQLNIDAPDHEPRATQSIGITVELIQELEKAGFTYTVDSDIYFDVAAFGTFGRLSGYPDKLLMALAKARGDDPARLGSTIDIHGGGKDLVFPHHECKRAIGEAVTGEPFVKHWVHTVSSTTPAKRRLNHSAIWSSSETLCVPMNPSCCA